jgi:hypothetical protein
MTAVWGPLGWMTLHSVATLYPTEPSPAERDLMNTWLDMFRDTITCPSCQGHFASLLATYRQQFPNMLASRHNFAIFTFRAHNAVNRRLNKPIQGDVEACMNVLKNNIKTRHARDYRIAYLTHITRHWRIYRDIAGIAALRKITEMNKIEGEYLQPRDTNFDVTIAPDVVVLPRDALDKSPEEVPMRIAPNPRFAPAQGFRLTAGGIRLRR